MFEGEIDEAAVSVMDEVGPEKDFFFQPETMLEACFLGVASWSTKGVEGVGIDNR